jgi:hypothetical protein
MQRNHSKSGCRSPLLRWADLQRGHLHLSGPASISTEFVALGYRIRLTCNTLADFRTISTYLPQSAVRESAASKPGNMSGALAGRSSPSQSIELIVTRTEESSHLEGHDAAGLFSQSFSHPAIASRRAIDFVLDRLFCNDSYAVVHAAAIVVGDSCVLLPGASCSGKSTLTAQLLRRGADYLSDDTSPIDDDGRVHPFARSISLRDSSGMRDVPSSSFGGIERVEPMRASMVILMRYDPDRGLDVHEISSGQAVVHALDHLKCPTSNRAAAMKRLVEAFRNTRCWAGTRGEAEEAAEWIGSLA